MNTLQDWNTEGDTDTMTILCKDGTVLKNIKAYRVCEYDIETAHAETEDGAHLELDVTNIYEIRGDIVEKV